MENDAKTFLIPNDLCRRGGMSMSWRAINQLGVFPHQKVVRATDKPSHFAGTEASVFHVRQDVILFHPVLRKLVNESNGTFLSVQTCSGEAQKKSDLLKLSHQYRSIIRAYLENLTEDLRRSQGTQKDDLRDYVTIFYSVECIWHLCEILFIDTLPGNIALSRLLDWIRFHFPKYERNAAAMLAEGLGGLESHPDYWETVIGSFLQGRLKMVRGLLRLHSDSDTQPFKIFDQCLRTIPFYNVGSGSSLTEFNAQWSLWISDIQSKIDAKTFVSCYNLNFLMKLAVAEENAWIEVRQYCETWYEYLAAWLFFTQPTVKTFELGQAAKMAIDKIGHDCTVKHLDRVLLAAMEFDVIKVIKEIQYLNESGWFVTHLTDLLYHAGQLNNIGQEENFSPESLREYFITEYATLLMSHNSLWQVGLSYLDHCPQNGIEVTKLLLPKVQQTSELQTMKIVKEAYARKLMMTAQSVCKVQAMTFKKRKCVANALVWAVKSRDSAFISDLADEYLKRFASTGILENADLFNNLGSAMFACPRLLFLGKFYEFQKLYSEDQHKNAGKLLVELLESRIVPKYFWGILLTNTIPFLESEELIFSADDTNQITAYLEEKKDMEELKDQCDLIQLAAVRNLARASLHEAQLN